jgi:uncharacterized protein (TIGR02300 family)
MAKPEWGSKHRCKSCSTTFYDMQKNPIICPSCETEHKPEKLLKSSPPYKRAKPTPPKPKVVEEGESTGVLLDDDAILKEEDADPSEDEDTDIGGVVAAPSKEEEL